MRNRKFIIVLFLVMLVSIASSADKVFISEDFHTLENWKPLYFPKIKSHTQYRVEKDKDSYYLKAVSNASASALINKREFNVYEYPKAKWRWKISNVYKKAEPGTKSGDDYPIRIYILFKYDPERLSFVERIKYEVAKIMYGEYPPDSTLNYVWASRMDSPDIMTSPYTDRAKLIALEKGPARRGEWVEESVDILADYRKSFGSDPPSTCVIAIMNDSDNTGESSVSYVSHFEVYR